MPNSPARFRKLVLGFGALAFMLTSCTTLFPRVDAELWAPPAALGRFVLGEVSIATKPTVGNLKQTAADLAVVAARRASLALVDLPDAPGAAPSDGVFRLTVSLEEREFPVDLDSYNSVSAVLKVWTTDPSPVLVGQIVYTEETKRTLRSTSYLAQVLGAVFQKLADSRPPR